MDPITLGLILGGAVFGMALLALLAVKSLLLICEPNEVIVFTGRAHKVDGHQVGYTVLRGGRRLRLPFIEQARRLDTTTMTVDIQVANAYSKGNIPLNVHAIANVKIALGEPMLGNAIERFLDRGRDEIRRVAKETIEGALRGVLATLTPEQVNEDRLSFVQKLSEDVDDDLAVIGLQIDTLKIQSVTDDVNYLDSIGRARIAEVLRDAEVAESNFKRDADRHIADMDARGRVAQEQANATVQARRNELRRVVAELEVRARSEEERTAAAETEARARAEVQLQQVRTELERLRLQADEVLPSDGRRAANELLAQGQAAHIAAQGQAQARALELMSEAWHEAGDSAADIYVIQQLESILARIIDKLKAVDIGHVNLVDSGDGEALGRLAAAYPSMVAAVLDSVSQTTGLDIRDILRRPLTGAGEARTQRVPRGDRPPRPKRQSVLDVGRAATLTADADAPTGPVRRQHLPDPMPSPPPPVASRPENTQPTRSMAAADSAIRRGVAPTLDIPSADQAKPSFTMPTRPSATAPTLDVPRPAVPPQTDVDDVDDETEEVEVAAHGVGRQRDDER